MFKLFGSMLVIGSCFAFALNAVKIKQKQIHSIKELYSFLTDLSQEIAFRLEPLPQLLNRLSQEENSFAFSLNSIAEQDAHRPFRDIWQEALSLYTIGNKLPDKAFKLLQALGDHLGEADFETETTRLQNAAKQLYALCNSLEENQTKAEKLTKSLGILLGISIVILLL